MFVVVVGSRECRGDKRRQQVIDLLEELRQKYSGLVLVTSSSDRGVGGIVFQHCRQFRDRFQVIDMHVRVYAQLSRAKLNQAYDARNLALIGIGEEFHVIVDANRKGAFENLVDKINEMEAPPPLILHEITGADELQLDSQQAEESQENGNP